MVMADYGDRGQRIRRRLPKKYFDQEFDLSPPQQLTSVVPTQSMTKVPKILAKPNLAGGGGNNVDAADGHQGTGEDRGGGGGVVDKAPVLMVKGRGVEPAGGKSNHVVTNIPGLLAGEGPIQSQLHHVQTSLQTPASATSPLSGLHSLRLPARSVRMIDECFAWFETGLEYLSEQTDFLVIGVLGLQGVGKSTVMSALAGTDIRELSKSSIFERSGNKFDGRHKTFGIDMYVTGERTIILDSQPVCSASVLDDLIHQDKKTPPSTTSSDYAALDNSAELQSLQIATFMMTVCNVVVVVMDWFADVSLFKFLQLAEMMKPSTPNAVTQATSNGLINSSDETADYYPHIAFVVNRAETSDFRPDCVRNMQNYICHLMSQSKLKYTGLLAQASSVCLPRVSRSSVENTANLFLLPDWNTNELTSADTSYTGFYEMTQRYHGHSDFTEQVRDLTHRLLSMPRNPLTNTPLTEKNWFHYAARTWDVIRKSQLLAEYSRLQS